MISEMQLVTVGFSPDGISSGSGERRLVAHSGLDFAVFSAASGTRRPARNPTPAHPCAAHSTPKQWLARPADSNGGPRLRVLNKMGSEVPPPPSPSLDKSFGHRKTNPERPNEENLNCFSLRRAVRLCAASMNLCWQLRPGSVTVHVLSLTSTAVQD